MGNENTDNLDIPPFLKRSGDKAPDKEVTMSNVEVQKPAKAKSKSPPKATKKAATKAPEKKEAQLDSFGFRMGSLKSRAAGIYAGKKGATLAEVKKETGSVQLNLLTDLAGRGFKIRREKEAGDGKRQVTRYFLSAK